VLFLFVLSLTQLNHLSGFFLSFLPRRQSLRFCSLQLLVPRLLVFSLASFLILPASLIPFLRIRSDQYHPWFGSGFLVRLCFLNTVYGLCFSSRCMVGACCPGVRLVPVVPVRGWCLASRCKVRAFCPVVVWRHFLCVCPGIRSVPFLRC
jgi:hypothetical protein